MSRTAPSSKTTTETTTTFPKILVPHDGTEASDKALDKAIEFAKALNSEIILLNVVDDRFVPPSATLAFLSEKSPLEDAKIQIVILLKQAAEGMLKDRITKAASQGAKIRHMLAVGSPADEIVAIANNEKASMIIMGSRQLTAKEKIKALGSVARRVSEISAVPVMIVN
ncbi:MAG: universal stress protein [Nitrososphaera sp.]|jgi:nucleotide-binding universal stress UspA family protein